MTESAEKSSQCPASQTLTDYSLGNLSPELYEHVAAHIERCRDCQQRLIEAGVASDRFLQGLRKPLQRDGYESEAACSKSVSEAEEVVRSAVTSRGPVSAEHEADADQKTVTFSSSTSKLELDSRAERFEQLGRYRLLEELGAGGMGKVYKALHTKLDRIVAVKVLNTSRLNDTDAVARFEREMKVIGRLQHAHVVQATDADHVDDVHFLVMEYVDGIDLSQLSRKLGPLPVAEACELVRQAALGLQYVHENGLVHRDIKPSNLMLVSPESSVQSSELKTEVGWSGNQPSQPCVKILDLGLALLERDGDGVDLTSSGQVMGTIDYMAPEQFENTHGVDIRADIYSLGATLFRLLTGDVPYSAEKYRSSLEKLAALARDEPQSVSTRRRNLPSELVTLVDQLLQRNPADRIQTPAEVAVALAPLSAGADLSGLLSGTITSSATDISSHGTDSDTAKTASVWNLSMGNAVRWTLAAVVLLVGATIFTDQWHPESLEEEKGGSTVSAPPAPVNASSEIELNGSTQRLTSETAPDPQAGLIAHWKFDGDVQDSSENSLHGTAEGNVEFVEGRVGTGALKLNGGFVRVAHDDRLRGRQPMSISIWINVSDDGPRYQPVISKEPWRLQLLGDQPVDLAFGVGRAGNLDRMLSSPEADYRDSRWHHVAIVLTLPKQMILYVDGIEVRRANRRRVEIDDAGESLIFGHEFRLRSSGFSGQIDDARIYDRALTAEEVALLSQGEGQGSVKRATATGAGN